jgi:hypothetical protein
VVEREAVLLGLQFRLILWLPQAGDVFARRIRSGCARDDPSGAISPGRKRRT